MTDTKKPAAASPQPQAPVSSGLNATAAQIAEQVIAGHATAAVEPVRPGVSKKTIVINGQVHEFILEQGTNRNWR